MFLNLSMSMLMLMLMPSPNDSHGPELITHGWDYNHAIMTTVYVYIEGNGRGIGKKQNTDRAGNQPDQTLTSMRVLVGNSCSSGTSSAAECFVVKDVGNCIVISFS